MTWLTASRNKFKILVWIRMAEKAIRGLFNMENKNEIVNFAVVNERVISDNV